jgi:putative hydrolase of the HAD superfamily
VKRKYKHIFFDLDNTLWDFEANSAVALNQAFKYFHLYRKVQDFNEFRNIYTGHNERLWDVYRHNGLTKQELIRQRFQHTFDKFGIIDVDPVIFNDIFLNLMPQQKELIPGTSEVLNYLYKKSYLLYIITNGFREVQEKKLELSGIRHYFSRLFISEEIKAQKPSCEIFEHALKSSNAKKSDSIMIGDSWDVDIEGARNAGIDQVFLSPGTAGKADDFGDHGIKRKTNSHTYIISNLSELFTIF